MSPVKVPANLPDLVRASFHRAKANGDVNFYPTQVAVLSPASTPASTSPSLQFQLRFSPSLANKPKPPHSSSSENKKPFNPFEAPPPQLTVAPIGASHTLVLNKFAIIPEHAILITRTFKPQTHTLEAIDLAATYACIRAYHDASSTERTAQDGDADGDGDGQELFAFFNCGEHSGASQAHRHLQLLPVARMAEDLAGEEAAARGWRVLATLLAESCEAGAGARVPFATCAESLAAVAKEADPDAQAEELYAVYRRLYRRACNAARAAEGVADAELFAGEAKISYNLAMTKDVMVICPRTAEGCAVVDKDGKEVGRLSLNGTILAGTALAKSKDEWDALREDPGQLWEILGKIGVPPETV